MKKLLVVATSNPGKLREMQAYLANTGWELRLKPTELEIEETGETFAANACLKASQIALATGNWAIADDSGLQVDALNGAPGVYSARYSNTDSERIARLLRELGDEVNRQAQFVCVVAIAALMERSYYKQKGFVQAKFSIHPVVMVVLVMIRFFMSPKSN
jgi:XTP/dITP diphosphohydrolase